MEVEVSYVTAGGELVVAPLEGVDVDRVCGGRPVRRVRSATGSRHYSGLFWSATNAGHVPYESRLELDRLWLADFDPAVTSLAAQPMWLMGVDGGVVRRHVPDLLLRGAGGSVLLVDVKPAVFVDEPEVAAVLAWTGRLCALRGWGYQVWSGGARVVLDNIRWIAMARRPGLVPATAVDRAVGGWCPGATISDLEAVAAPVAGVAGGRAAVLAAMWAGALVADLGAPLHGGSVLELGCGW